MLPDVVAAGLEECGEDDRAADGACVRDILAVWAVVPLLVTARLVNLRDEAVVGVLVAEGALPHARVCRSGITTRMRAVAATYTHARRIKRLEAVVVCGNGVSRELHSDMRSPSLGEGAEGWCSQKTDISSMPPIPEATSIWPH